MEIEGAIRISQWGYGEGANKVPLYITTMSASALAEKAEIHRKTPDVKDGYQRALSEVRLGKGKGGVAGYLLNQMGIFPTSTLVNIRKEDAHVEFESRVYVGEFMETGVLHLPDSATWYVVDGQHRLEGLKTAMREEEEIKDYPVILSLTNEDRFYEMLIFYIVNGRAKSVDTALAYEILQRMQFSGEAPPWVDQIMSGVDRRKAISAEVVDILQGDENSPFKNRVREYGEAEKTEHVVTSDTLARYITLILKEKIFQDMYEKDIAELLERYWNAIKGIYPDTFTNHRNYVLLDTFGLSVMSRLFPTIYGYCTKDGDASEKGMRRYLEYLLKETPEHKDSDFKGSINEEWWHKIKGPGLIKGTGEGNYTAVYGKLAEKIKFVVSSY